MGERAVARRAGRHTRGRVVGGARGVPHRSALDAHAEAEGRFDTGRAGDRAGLSGNPGARSRPCTSGSACTNTCPGTRAYTSPGACTSAAAKAGARTPGGLSARHDHPRSARDPTSSSKPK